MRKTVLWTAFGFGLAVALGLAGLGHLSATVFTLTVFCSVQAFIFFGRDFLSARRKFAE